MDLNLGRCSQAGVSRQTLQKQQLVPWVRNSSLEDLHRTGGSGSRKQGAAAGGLREELCSLVQPVLLGTCLLLGTALGTWVSQGTKRSRFFLGLTFQHRVTRLCITSKESEASVWRQKARWPEGAGHMAGSGCHVKGEACQALCSPDWRG